MPKLVKVIPGTQSTIQILVQGEQVLARKYATHVGAQEVIDQVEMLQAIPSEIAKHYPQLLDYEIKGDASWYTTPFYDNLTLREILLYSSLPDKFLHDVMNSVINFIFSVHHVWRQQTPPIDYVETIYLDRPIKRLEKMRSISPFFEFLFTTKEIIIDGERFGNPIHILDKLKTQKEAIARIRPKTLCFTHGQIEFEHILVDFSNTSPMFILLDARGLNQLLDPAYDAGKILQCTSGLIDWLEEDFFDLGEIIYHDHFIDVRSLYFSFPSRLEIAASLNKYVEREILFYMQSKETEFARSKIYLAEATHLLSAVPFCYRDGSEKNDLDRAIACALMGIKSLKKFLDTLEQTDVKS